MKTFGTTVVTGTLLVAGLVFMADPAFRWRDAPEPFYRNLAPNEARLSPHNFDERTMKTSHIRFIEKPDVLILGSSRVAVVSSDLFNPKLDVFNGGMASSTLEDFIAIYQDLKESGKLPSYLLVFADPWQFNTAYNQSHGGWRSIGKYVDDFYTDLGRKRGNTEAGDKNLEAGGPKRRTLQDRWEKIKINLTHNTEIVSELLTWPMVRASLIFYFKGGNFRDRVSNRIVLKSELTGDERGIDRDGSVIFPEKERRPKDPAELQRIVTENLTKPNSLYDHWTFDRENQAMLQALMGVASAQDIRVMIISPPLHPSVLRLLPQRPGYSEVLADASAAIQAIIKPYPTDAYCEAEDSRVVGCDESEMSDDVHMLKPCMKKVLEYCLKAPSWSRLLPK